MAPPARPVWTGQIRLALVALPVKLYSALDSREKISFNQIHEPSKQRIRYEKVAPGIGAVDKDEIVKGYEYQKGRYVLFSDEEFEALQSATVLAAIEELGFRLGTFADLAPGAM